MYMCVCITYKYIYMSKIHRNQSTNQLPSPTKQDKILRREKKRTKQKKIKPPITLLYFVLFVSFAKFQPGCSRLLELNLHEVELWRTMKLADDGWVLLLGQPCLVQMAAKPKLLTHRLICKMMTGWDNTPWLCYDLQVNQMEPKCSIPHQFLRLGCIPSAGLVSEEDMSERSLFCPLPLGFNFSHVWVIMSIFPFPTHMQ